jgi:hypothetical protein
MRHDDDAPAHALTGLRVVVVDDEPGGCVEPAPQGEGLVELEKVPQGDPVDQYSITVLGHQMSPRTISPEVAESTQASSPAIATSTPRLPGA